MLFNSYIFLIFISIALPVFYLIPRKSRNLYLLSLSYLFYGYWDWRFCGLLAFSTLTDFYIGGKIFKSSNPVTRKKWLTLSVFLNISVLFLFKYFNFFVDSFEAMIQPLGGHLDYLHLNIILPVGISFYTFQTLSYTIDIYRGHVSPTRKIVDFSLFVAFFPQLVAGPIEKAKHLLPQISKSPLPTRTQVNEGLVLIVMGYFKKVMIGDTSGRYVDRIFGDLQAYSSPEILTALILFSVQIYADFSGYSSIARGLAKLLGIELIRNFEQPYLSASISEFWRRWHISLGSWIKEYIYIPLGGNKKGELRTYINLMLTMIIIGLWHGASWTFVVYGFINGVYLVTHRFLLNGKKIKSRYKYEGLKSFLWFISGVIFTNLLVMVTRIFFRAPTFQDAKLLINKLLIWEPSMLGERLVFMAVAYASISFFIDVLEYYTRSHTFILKIPSKAVRLGISLPLVIIVLVYMFQAKPLPFIYFQF